MTAAWVPLATTTLSSSASSVTFGSISGSYRDLVLVVQAIHASSTSNYGIFRVNSDTGSNYSYVHMQGTGSATSSGAATTNFGFLNFLNTSSNQISVSHFMDYSATDKHKTILTRCDSPFSRTRAEAVRWSNTDAITSITIAADSGNLAAGSTFSLYGSNKL